MPLARPALFLAMVLAAARASADESIPRVAPIPETVVVVPTAAEPPTTAASPAPAAEIGPANPSSADLSADRTEPAVEFGTMEVCGRSWFVESFVGCYHSAASLGPEIPRFEYMPIAFRLGCRPWEDRGFFARRFSFLVELAVDPVTEGYGNFMVGPSVMFRFEACPDRRISPYLQGGTGFVLNDAYRDQSQRAIGESFEFLQQVEVGLRWNITDRLAIESEIGLQHISNAGLASRNFGVNSLGASVGVRWMCGPGK